VIIKTESEFLQSIIAEFVARTGASDIRAGGTMYQYAKALARQLYLTQANILNNRDNYYLSTARGDDLDKRVADMPPGTIVRGGGTRANGGVVLFSRPVATGPLTILAGTLVVRSSDKYRYTTTSNATFGPADLVSSSVSVIAQTYGTIGNVVAGEIDSVGSPIVGVTAVTNTSAIQNGEDAESDDELRQRISLYVKGIARSTTAALVQAILNLTDDTYGTIKFAKCAPVLDDYPGRVSVYIDDGAGTAGLTNTIPAGEVLINSAIGNETILYLANRPAATAPIISVNAVPMAYKLIFPWGQVQVPLLTAADHVTAGAYEAYIGLVALAQQVIDGKPYNPINYPGYRAAGEIVTVLPALLAGGVYVDIDVWFDVEPNADRGSIISTAKAAMVKFINELDIGKPLYRAALIDVLMEQSGIVNVSSVQLNLVDVDLYVADNGVARTSDSNITFH